MTTTLTKFTAESLTAGNTAHTFDVWAVDHDDAWTVADEFAKRNRFGKVDEIRATGVCVADRDEPVDGELAAIRPHVFVESGPGQEPATVRGCIVCPDCYQAKRSPVHVTRPPRP